MQIQSFLGQRNELPCGMKPIRALIQKFREKSRIYQEIPNLCSGNNFYKRFQMTKIAGSVFSMTNKKIENISHLDCVAKWRVNCKVSIKTHEELHKTLRNHARKY